jgi:glycosyltransferase involved in cell wall biosynthesis
MANKPPIDLILPVYLPGPDWPLATLKYLDGFEQQVRRQVNLIVVNDGGKDHSAFERLSALLGDRVRIIHLPENRGKGHALRTGIAQAQSDVMLYTDADFPYTLDSMWSIVETLDQGYDVALGYREKDYYASVPWFRKGLSELLRFLLKRALHSPITDTQCGLKGMSRGGREIFLNTHIDRFLVDLEFIQNAVRNERVSMATVVVKLRPDVVFSTMGAGVLVREGLNFVRLLFR